MRSTTSLSGGVSRGNVEDKFAETIAEHGRKARANEPTELVLGGIRHERLVRNQDDRHGEDGQGQKDVEETEKGVDEAGHSSGQSHVLDRLTPQTKLELESGIDGSDGLN